MTSLPEAYAELGRKASLQRIQKETHASAVICFSTKMSRQFTRKQASHDISLEELHIHMSKEELLILFYSIYKNNLKYAVIINVRAKMMKLLEEDIAKKNLCNPGLEKYFLSIPFESQFVK